MSADGAAGRPVLQIGRCDPEQRHVGVAVAGPDDTVGPDDAAGPVDLDDVELEDAVVDGLVLDGGRISRLVLVDVRAHRVSLVATELPDGRWQRVTVAASRLAGCGTDGALWEDVELTEVRAPGLSARQATWRRVTATGCDLSGADLSGARLDAVRLEGCRLVDVELGGARAGGLTLVGCDLTGARGVSSLRGATVDGVSLTSLTGAMAAELGLRSLPQAR